MLPADHLPAGALWVAVPVYNNRATVREVAAECRGLVANVVVVDDGSSDADLTELLAGLDVVVLRHPVNQGKGAALLTASRFIEEQGGLFMVTIDADGQHFPADIATFLPLLAENDPAIVIGCRDFDTPNVPKSSRFGRAFANFWLRVETGQRVDDCQSGFRTYPVRYLNRLPFKGTRYDFEAEVLARAAWAGLALRCVPIAVHYPKPAERVSSFRPFLDNLRLTRIHSMLVGRRLCPWPHRRLLPRTGVERRRGNRLGFWFFRTAAKRFGLGGAYGLLHFVCPWYLLTDRPLVNATLAYVRRRFPSHGWLRQLRDVYRLFVSQGRSLIDRHALAAGYPGIAVDIRGYDGLRELLAGEKGFILLTAHVGNWQVAMTALKKFDRDVCLLMRPEDNAAVKEALNIDAGGERIEIISTDDGLGGVIAALKALDSGKLISIMGDRPYGFSATATEFLGGTVRFPHGAFTIAAAAQCPVVVLLSAKTGPRRYQVDVSHILPPPAGARGQKEKAIVAAVADFARILESYVAAYPYQWFGFRDIWTADD